MKQNLRRTALVILAAAAAAAVVLLLLRLRPYLSSITADDILDRLPQERWKAGLFLLLLYLAKSCTVFFPVTALQLSAGFLFPIPQALLLNLAGTAGALSLPYWIGRRIGQPAVDWIGRRYPKAQELMDRFREQDLFYSYLVRVVGCLPMDILSLLSGAMAIPYHRYLPAALLGMLPATAAVTVLGSSITQPGTLAFWLSLAATVLLSVGSLLLYRLLRRKGYFLSHTPS